MIFSDLLSISQLFKPVIFIHFAAYFCIFGLVLRMLIC